jgi:hypothetical protein
MATQNAKGKADLTGGRSGKELAERDQISIGRLVEPFAAFDEFIAEVSQMRDRAAERANEEGAGLPPS